MLEVKLKWEVKTDKPGREPSTHPPHHIQPPWQDAGTDVSTMSQEVCRVAYRDDGFLMPLEVAGGQNR